LTLRSKELPWDLAQAAIADKKCELMNKIGALQQQHAGLVAFEASLETTQDQCRLGNL
jgi:MerR family transcriptional regulator, copper efflux regulator